MNNIRLRLTPAIDCYLVALIYRNTRTSCCSLAALCARMSHDTLRRLLHAKLSWSRRRWFGFARQLVSRGGYLVLDDTSVAASAPNTRKPSRGCGHQLPGVRLRGMQVGLLISTDGRRKVPVGMRVWCSGGRSKVELAGEMLDEAARRKLTPEYVLFDSWYTAAALVNRLDERGWKYVARRKPNRLLDGTAVRSTWRTRFGHGTGNLRKVNHTVLEVCDGQTILCD